MTSQTCRRQASQIQSGRPMISQNQTKDTDTKHVFYKKGSLPKAGFTNISRAPDDKPDPDRGHRHQARALHIYILDQRVYEFGNVGMIQQVLRGLFYLISQFGRTVMLSCVFFLFLFCLLLGGGRAGTLVLFESSKNPVPEFLGIPEYGCWTFEPGRAPDDKPDPA